MQLAPAILLLATFGGIVPAAHAAPTPVRRPSVRQERTWLAPAIQAAHRGHWDQAYWLASDAARAHAQDRLIQSVCAALKQQAVRAYVVQAQREQERGLSLAAALDYRAALAIDPSSPAARHGLDQILSLPAPAGSGAMRIERAAPPPQLTPAPGLRKFELDTGLRQAIGAVAAAYGLHAYIQNAVPDAPVRLHMGEASFPEAMRVLRQLGGVDWMPLGPRTIYVGLARQAQRFEPLEVRTFYLPWLAKPADLVQLEETLRIILDPYEVQGDTSAHSITIRARPPIVDAAEQLLLNLGGGAGGVLFEVKIAEVSRSFARQLGVTTPYQLQALALGPILSQFATAASSESQLLQDLFANGGLNNLLNAGQIGQQLSALESQLAPLLATPFATFGGGLTAMALTLPPATLNLSLEVARTTTLETAWLRAESGQPATLKLGERYPVINATFSPILDSAAVAKVLGSGSFRPPFPSFTFVNLGLNLKLTPHLDGRGGMIVQVQAQEQELSGTSNNGVPILEDHKLSTLVDLRDGEPALIAGLGSRQNTGVRTALPGLGQIPGFGDAFGSSQTNRASEELVVIVTPHILRTWRPRAAAIWLPASDFRAGAGPLYSPPYRPYRPVVPLPERRPGPSPGTQRPPFFRPERPGGTAQSR